MRAAAGLAGAVGLAMGMMLVGCAGQPDYVLQGGWEYDRHAGPVDGHDYRLVVRGGRVEGQVGLVSKDETGRIVSVRWVELERLRVVTPSVLEFEAPLGPVGGEGSVRWRLEVVEGFESGGWGQGLLQMVKPAGRLVVRIPLERRDWTFAEAVPILSQRRAVVALNDRAGGPAGSGNQP